MTVPFARSQNALVLISPEAAGPNVNPYSYVHDHWIRWPHSYEENGLNRLLSLTSGEDWRLGYSHFSFKEVQDGYRNKLHAHLLRIRFMNLGSKYVVLREKGTNVDFSLLAAASAGGEDIRVISNREEVGKSEMLLAKAVDWDSVALLSKSVPGRTLVVEYPPKVGESWSRLWLYGKGWPSGAPTSGKLSGLVEARDVTSLIKGWPVHKFELTDPLKFGGANRWLRLGHQVNWIRFLLAFVLVTPMLIASLWIGREWSSKGKELVTVVALSVFSSSVFVGDLARIMGVAMIWIWWFLAALILSLGGSWWLQKVLSKQQHPLLGFSNLLLLFAVLSRGNWSPLSPTITGAEGVFQEQLGLICVLGAFSIRWSRLLDGLPWLLPRLCLLIATVQGVISLPEWAGGRYELCVLPLAAWLMGDGVAGKPIWAVCLFNPDLLMKAGVTWAPFELVSKRGDRSGINVYEVIIQLVQPQTIVILTVIGAISMLSPRFLGYQLKRVWRQHPELSVGLSMTLAIGLFGVGCPSAFGAVPWALGLTGVIWSFDALRSL